MIDIQEYKMIVNRIRNLQRYEQELAEIEDDIINASPQPPDGLPKGNTTGNPVEIKALRHITNKRSEFLTNMINDIKYVYSQLDDELQAVWNKAIVKNKSIIALERELCMSRNTIYRKKRYIIETLAKLWGIK